MPHPALTKEILVNELIPICANCGKVRNADGEWEEYQGDIAEIGKRRLTHGICPVCAHELYPEIFPTVAEMAKC